MVNKDKIKGFAIGALSMAVLLTASSALADPVSKQISAVYNGIKLVVNGNPVTPQDSDGNVVDPFIADGSTYLPVRAVSTALGMPVEWDGKTQTVYIGKKPDGSLTSLTSLPVGRSNSSFNYNDWTGQWSNKQFSIAGKTYSTGIAKYYWGDENSYVVYNLNSQYKTLTADIGMDDVNKTSGDSTAQILIYGDGKEIYRSPKVQPGDVKSINVDLSGVNQLKIVFTGAYPVLGNPTLK